MLKNNIFDNKIRWIYYNKHEKLYINPPPFIVLLL